MIVSMHSWLRRRILIGFRIKNEKHVNNLLKYPVKTNGYIIKNEKNVDKFERSGYNKIEERLKTENA